MNRQEIAALIRSEYDPKPAHWKAGEGGWDDGADAIASKIATKSPIQDQLIVALELALEEIHHPGANRSAGIDITAVIEGVIKAATDGEPGADQIGSLVRDEIATRAD